MRRRGYVARWRQVHHGAQMRVLFTVEGDSVGHGERRRELERQFPGWEIWYVPRGPDGVTWRGRPRMVISADGPEGLAVVRVPLCALALQAVCAGRLGDVGQGRPAALPPGPLRLRQAEPPAGKPDAAPGAFCGPSRAATQPRPTPPARRAAVPWPRDPAGRPAAPNPG